MAADRDFFTFDSTGIFLLSQLEFLLNSSPMSNYWENWGWHAYELGDERKGRLMVRHKESGEVFNLIQHCYNFQEILTIHSCADTIYRELYSEWGVDDYYRLNYNVPSSSMQLTYPVGTTPVAYFGSVRFTLVGTSKMIFIGSDAEKDGADFSSQGVFGLLNSYDGNQYKFTGGLPMNNKTMRAFDFEHHFWESGYQNLSMKFVEGSTFHLTTFQVHDYSEFGQNSYDQNYLFPLTVFENSGPGYSGRIAGGIPDCWRLANNANSLATGDDIWMGDTVAGASIMGRLFKDGESLTNAMVVRYHDV
jgi:hypothetical protein